jgi:hypothetical protein
MPRDLVSFVQHEFSIEALLRVRCSVCRNRLAWKHSQVITNALTDEVLRMPMPNIVMTPFPLGLNGALGDEPRDARESGIKSKRDFRDEDLLLRK